MCRQELRRKEARSGGGEASRELAVRDMLSVGHSVGNMHTGDGRDTGRRAWTRVDGMRVPSAGELAARAAENRAGERTVASAGERASKGASRDSASACEVAARAPGGRVMSAGVAGELHGRCCGGSAGDGGLSLGRPRSLSVGKVEGIGVEDMGIGINVGPALMVGRKGGTGTVGQRVKGGRLLGVASSENRPSVGHEYADLAISTALEGNGELGACPSVTRGTPTLRPLRNGVVTGPGPRRRLASEVKPQSGERAALEQWGQWGGKSLGALLSVNSGAGGGQGEEGKVGRHVVAGSRRAAGSLRALNVMPAGQDYDTILG